MIGSKVGAILAGAHTIKITIEGHGGHAAMPHTTKDPVVAGDLVAKVNTISNASRCNTCLGMLL